MLCTLSTWGRLKNVMRTSSITNVTSIRRHLLGVEDVTGTLNAHLFTSSWSIFWRRNDQTFDVQMTKLFILIYLTFNHKIYSFCTAPLPLPLYYIMTVLLPSLTLPHPPLGTTTVNVSIWFGNIFVYINFCNWEHINNRQTFLIPKTWNDPILSLKLTVTIFFFKMLAPGTLLFPWFPSQTDHGVRAGITAIWTMLPGADRYPLPNIRDFTNNVKGCTVFSKLNLVKGYHQVPMDPADVWKTTVVTPFGLFEFLSMSFGLKIATQTFQQLMDQNFRGLPYVFVYLNDVLVTVQIERPTWSTSV